MESRSYFIEVTSRSKQGWKHIFYNPKTNERLVLEMYWMSLIDKSGKHSIKLNESNERLINSLISNFLRL